MARAEHLSELVDLLVQRGAKTGHIRRLLRAWMHLGPWEERSNDRYPKRVAEFLPEFKSRLQGLSRVLPIESRQPDSMKLIVGLHDGECVESVLLPRQALCISTQVGCAVGCVFCMTGKSGLIRQLSSAEILAQVAEARAIRPNLKKVVLMGMGEPSHNLKAVCEAIEFMGTTLGMAHKEIVVSTVGDRRLFEVLPTLSVKPAIALSLHTTDNEKRRRLLTNAAPLSVEEVLESTLSYAEATKYPAQIEWTLMAGVNDTFEEVERLADLLEGRYAMVNFIAVNPIDGSPYQRPSDAHMQDLITILRRRGIVATIRMSAAQDVDGGCGQLRARVVGRQSEVQKENQ
ncbi:MAG: RNA methyltransferase [Duodenibacillus sp.]|jgi:23S rRNA (adenine2503-C2)-methyltransferase|nr:RNA methyltransferase [Duodenibacillus sp.]